MSDFFTSDHHLSHENIIAFDQRPWKTIEKHDAGLIKRWNKVVGPEDTVYHLGDFFMGMYGAYIAEIRTVLQQLNGRLILIGGNHDAPLRKFFHRDFLVESLEVRCPGKIVQLALENRSVLPYAHSRYDIDLCHYPVRPTDDVKRTMKPRVRLHGHTHNREMVVYRSNGVIHVNVGVYAHKYAPLPLERVEQLIEGYRTTK